MSVVGIAHDQGGAPEPICTFRNFVNKLWQLQRCLHEHLLPQHLRRSLNGRKKYMSYNGKNLISVLMTHFRRTVYVISQRWSKHGEAHTKFFLHHSSLTVVQLVNHLLLHAYSTSGWSHRVMKEKFCVGHLGKFPTFLINQITDTLECIGRKVSNVFFH